MSADQTVACFPLSLISDLQAYESLPTLHADVQLVYQFQRVHVELFSFWDLNLTDPCVRIIFKSLTDVRTAKFICFQFYNANKQINK